MKQPSRIAKHFSDFSAVIVKWAGKPITFALALFIVIGWTLGGLIFGFSDTYQLIINTGTTCITFLIVFVIQHSQNKDVIALHIKLDELIAANKKTSNRLVAIEDLTEEELEEFKSYYKKLMATSKKGDVFAERSIDALNETITESKENKEDKEESSSD